MSNSFDDVLEHESISEHEDERIQDNEDDVSMYSEEDHEPEKYELTHKQKMSQLKFELQTFEQSTKRREYIDIPLLETMYKSKKYDNEFSTDPHKQHETIAKTMERVLDNANKRKDYYKGEYHQETCSRDYNKFSAGTLPRDVRKKVLHNYDDIDMDSSHVNCLIALTRTHGIEVPQILIDVVMKKNEIRRMIADEEGVSIDDAKKN